jgi:hypothetical protein
MARKPRPGGGREPITIRAAKIGGKYAIIAAIVGGIVAAAATEGFGLLAPNGHGSAPAGVYYTIVLTSACQKQYNDSSLTSKYENWNDPNSWVCVTSSGAVVGNVNIQGWCDYDHPGSTAVNVDNTAYGWRCRTLRRSPISAIG